MNIDPATPEETPTNRPSTPETNFDNIPAPAAPLVDKTAVAPSGTPVPVPPKPIQPPPTGSREVVIYRHSNLFYWWPIWAFGFLFAIITYFSGETLAVVPVGTEAAPQRRVDVDGLGDMQTRDVLILRDKAKLPTMNLNGETIPIQPRYRIVANKTLGTVFVILLVIVISVTNVPIRGLWSVLFVILIVMMSLIFALAGWWEIILNRFGQLAIYINMGGYLFLATVLFILWLLNFTIFDRQIYMIFSPGQVRVRLEIGGEETVYDSLGMVVQKTRTDVFRHYILGFGSGDLLIRPVGLGHALELPNVMNVTQRVRAIEQIIKERTVVTERAKPKT